MCIGMLNNFFKYYKTDSFIHSINPLGKILMFIIFIFISIFSTSIKSVIALFIVMMFIVGLSNIPYKNLFEPFCKFKFFFLILFLLCMFFGFFNSICIVLKISLLFLYYIILMKSTKVDDFIKGFYFLLFPFRFFGFSIDIWSINFALVFDFPSLVIDEFNKLYRLRLSRNLLNCDFKVDFYLFFRIFSNAYKCALSKRNNIIIRGFNFIDDDYKWRLSDAYIVMCNLIVLVLVLVKEVVV